MIRILTVRQPWAWAIIHAGKDIENRSRNIAGSYRGPVLIHAGLTAVDHDDALWDRGRFREALASTQDREGMSVRGLILGVVDLVDVHAPHDGLRASGRGQAGGVHWGTWKRCSEWAEPTAWHLSLANPRPLVKPIPFRGGLGLRRAPFIFDGSSLIEEAGEARRAVGSFIQQGEA